MVLADFCKQQLVAIKKEVVKVPVEGKYTQSSVADAVSVSWEN